MVFLSSLWVALDAIRSNKLRSLLTMLGVIIGVASVIIMVAIVQGVRKTVVDQFSGNGANLIFAFYAPKPDSIHRGGYEGVSMADVIEVQRHATLVGAISPTQSTQVTARHGARSKSVQVNGVLAAYSTTENMGIAQGRFISAEDDDTYSKACVIGKKVNADLFGGAGAIGQELIATQNGASVSLTVVGVLEEKDRGPDGVDFNNGIFMSLRSLERRFIGDDHIGAFSTRANDVARTQEAADQIWNLLRRRHPLNYKDFIVDTSEGLLKRLDTLLMTLQLVLGGTGALALLTGGIGIMNIMLVSVTERTREIGIRKAVGATRGAILVQFLVEAMVVAGLGGLVGIALGMGVSALVDHFAHKILPTYVPFWVVLLGFGFAVGVGMFFGIYPASRAAKMDPITALRHE